MTTTSESLFRTVFEMQPRDAGSGSGATVTREDKVKQILDEIIEKLPEEFSMTEIMNKVEERTPYVIVAFQECERMNYLTGEMKRSLKELDLGLKVTLEVSRFKRKLTLKFLYILGGVDHHIRYGSSGKFVVLRSSATDLDISSISISARLNFLVRRSSNAFTRT